MKIISPTTVAVFWDGLEKIGTAQAAWTPAHLHRVAEKLGIDYDTDEFRAKCQALVGKAHLDDMSSKELQKLAVHLLKSRKEKQAAVGIPKLMKPPSTPQVSRSITLKPLTPSSASVKVPSGVSAKAGTATNVTDLKASSAIYG